MQSSVEEVEEINISRRCVVLRNRSRLKEIQDKLTGQNKTILWVSDKKLQNSKNIFYICEKNANTCLGKTFDCLVIENFGEI